MKINAGKFARIPAKYSEDLHRAIRWMLTLETAKRPSVEDLEKLPQIRAMSREASLVVKEYSINHSYTTRMRELKAKEEEVARREAAVASMERAIREKEASLAARATELQRREAALAARLGSMGDDESRRYSMGDRLRPPTSGGSVGGSTGSGAPLHRAHSMSEIPVGGMGSTVAQAGMGGIPAGTGMGGGVPDLRRARSFSSQAGAPSLSIGVPSDATIIPVSVSSRPPSSGGLSTTSSSSLPTPVGFSAPSSGFGGMGMHAASSAADAGEDTEMAGAPSSRRGSVAAAPLGLMAGTGSNTNTPFMGSAGGIKTMGMGMQPRMGMGIGMGAGSGMATGGM